MESGDWRVAPARIPYCAEVDSDPISALAYIDAMWIIAWVLVASLAIVLVLRSPPPNPLTPPRIRM